jgi:tetratricopeptide (TPR) repeat protein
MKGSPTSANTGSWLSTHGKLWYDDPWYRTAWIVWPQAVGLLLFVSLWLGHLDGGQGYIPWAKPAVETPRPVKVIKEPTAPPPAAQPADVLAPCKSGDFGQIIQACTSLLASGILKGGDIAQGYYRRGWAYFQTRQYQLAMTDYDRAIAISPSVYYFYNDRGITWRELSNNDRAMQDFDQAILLKPDYALAYANRGHIMVGMQRFDEAIAALSTALSYDPKLAWAYQNRATAYEMRSNWRALFDDANKLIELEPRNKLGFAFRGHAYFEVGQYSPAIADFSKLISIDPRAVYGYRMRGRAYYLSNQSENAIADFENALRIDPNDKGTILFMNELRRSLVQRK